MGRELILLSVSLVLLASGGLDYIRADEGASGEDPTLAPDNSSCSDRDVRLVRGSSGYMGMVEACYSTDTNSSLWAPVCVTVSSNSWTVFHARAVCTQIGLPSSEAVSISYENVTGPYSYELWCSPWNPPNSLHGCDVDATAPACSTMKAGGVICHVPEEKRCKEGDVCLVNGSSLAGRLEVCFNGVWGTICRHQHWSSLHASVVCRQLGFTDTSAIPIGVATDMFGYGLSTQPILIMNVECSGNENNISECSHSEINNVGVCLHTDDAGVICEAPPGSCRDGDIRVEDGTVGTVDSVSGNIEVCYTGFWGTVCATVWNAANGVVACRELGYAELETTQARPIMSGEARLQSLLSGVNCSGSEERLADCDHDGVDLGDTTGCARAFVRCLKQIPTGVDSSSMGDTTAIIIGGSVGATVILLLIVVTVVVIATVIVLKVQTVRKKMNSMLEVTRNDSSVLDRKKHTEKNASQEKLINWNKKMTISKLQIHLSSTIGQGEYGLVYKGYIGKGSRLVAIKTSKALCSERDRENLLKEVGKMASLEHNNVMTLIGVCLDGEMPLIIMPFMTKGSVLEYVRNMKEIPLQEQQMKTNFLGICHQITKGMKYLSDCKFVHRDLAARNCMIDDNNVIKVADFGLSEDVYSSGYFCQSKEEARDRGERMPIRWMAPESIESGRYSEKTDVWSFGVTCWEIFTFGCVPYSGIRAMSILNLLKSGERLERPTNGICSEHIYDVMRVCWSEVSSDRPNFQSLVHTFDDILEKESGYLDLCSP